MTRVISTTRLSVMLCRLFKFSCVFAAGNYKVNTYPMETRVLCPVNAISLAKKDPINYRGPLMVHVGL